MSFDSTDYFASKIKQIDSTSKKEELLKASQEKIANFEATRAASVMADYQREQAALAAQESWAGKLDLNVNSLAGGAVNLGASLVSGASRLAGQAVNLPINAFAASEDAYATPEQLNAYNRYQSAGDLTSPEDMAILNQKTGGTKGGPTVLNTFQSAQKARDVAGKVQSFFDLTGIVNQKKRDELAKDLGADFSDAWNEVKTGWTDGKDGEILSGSGNVLAGLTRLLYNAGEAAITNPGASAEYVVENIPQLAIGALGKAGPALLGSTNVAYAADTYREGIKAYQDAHGQEMPDASTKREMALYAASLALAEHVGDASLLKGMRNAVDTSTGFKAGLANIAREIGKGAVTEGLTEGYQTFAEGEIKNYDENYNKVGATPLDIYTGATIGAIAGGSMKGGVKALTELSKTKEPEVQVEDTPAYQETFKKAVEENNPDVFLDKESSNYKPEAAVGVLLQAAKVENATPEVKSANFTKATKIVESLEQERDALISGKSQAILDAEAAIAGVNQLISKTDPADKVKIRDLNSMIKEYEKEIASDPTAVDPAEMRKLESALSVSRRVQNELGTLANPVTPETFQNLVASVKSTEKGVASTAADTLINLSMTSPSSIDDKVLRNLVSDKSNGLKPEQRAALRKFTETRKAENALMTMGKVSAQILTGDPAKRQLGIKNYRDMVGTAIATGNQKAVERPLALMAKFLESHSEKAALTASALLRSGVSQVVRLDNGSWEIRDPALKPFTAKQMFDSGSVTVNPELEASVKLVETIGKEAKILAQSYKQLSESVAAKFATNSTKAPVVSIYVQENGQDKSRPETSSGEKVNQPPLPSSKLDEVAPKPSKLEQGRIRNAKQEAAVKAAEESIAKRKKDKEALLQSTSQPSGSSVADAPSATVVPTTTNKEVSKEAQAELDKVSLTVNELVSQLSIEEIQNEITQAEIETASARTTSSDASEVSTGNPIESPEGQATTEQPDVATAESPVAEVVAGPVLTVFTKKEPKGSTKPFVERNAIAEYLIQDNSSVKGTARPLATVKDFISSFRAGTVKVSEFVADGKKLTARQKNVVLDFMDKAEKWSETIKNSLVKRPDAKFFYNDVMQHLINDDVDLDENIKTAMSHSAYLAIAEMANGKAFNDASAINRILGLDSDTFVDPQAWALFGDVGSLESMIRNSLGQAFVSVIGFKGTKNTPINMLPQLEAAAGAHIVELLINTGMVERVEVERGAFDAFASATKQLEQGTETDGTQDVSDATYGQGTVSFLRLVREGKEPNPEAKAIGELMKDTKGILDSIFGTEPRMREPSLDPQEYSQEKTANARMNVPSDLKDALQTQQKQGYKINQDLFGLITTAPKDTVLAMMGFKPVEGLQKASRRGQQAKNDGLEREYDRLLGFVNNTLVPVGLDKSIYFAHDAWKNQRVGIKTNEVNPQSSKFHRQMMYKDGMDSVIDVNNTEQMNNLRLRVGEGFGVKVDKQANEVSLKDFEKKISNPKVEAALAALNKQLHKEALTDDDFNAIAEGVEFGGEDMHTMSALMAWAQYQFALENKQTEVTVQLMGEVDGVTNGPMLTHLLMGIASSANNLFSMLNRGGFFQVGNPAEQYNVWRGIAGHMDLYEKTTQQLMTELKKLVSDRKIDTNVLKAVNVFTGVLEDEAGNITKDGRGIIKTPLTALVFGSAVKRSVESMAETFVEDIYKRIQMLADGNTKAPTKEAMIASLNTMGLDISLDSTIDDLMELEFNTKQINVLKGAFIETIGVATEQAINTHFATFIATRDTFNRTAQTAFNLYSTTYQAVRKEYVKEKISTGEMEVNGVGEALNDLTKDQEAELDTRLSKAMPILHTAMSSMNDELDAGLFMSSKGDVMMNMNQAYSNEVKIKRNGKASSYTTHGYSRRMAGPGVAMFSASTHSSDSAIAHRAVRLVNALNNHDALSTGVNHIVKAGEALNQATWEVTLAYSPATQVTNALLRTVEGVVDFIKNDPLGEVAKPALAGMIKDILLGLSSKRQYKGLKAESLLRTLAIEAKQMANQADAIRLETLSKVAVVSQYAIEGGAYKVSTEKRAQAAKQLKEYKTDFNEAQRDALMEFDKLINPNLAIKTEATEVDTLVEYADLPVLVLNNTQALQLLNHGKSDKSDLSTAIRNQMKLVYGAMTKGKLSLNDALIDALRPMDAAIMVQLLNDRYFELDPNHWGEVGQPSIDSDPVLLNMFVAQPDMTGGAMIKRLRAHMKKDNNTNKANLVLLEQIERVISPNLRVRFVTPTTPVDDVIAKANGDRSRGWYTAKGEAEGIYVLSPDFKYSGLTTELLMHELTHAALVHATMDADNNPEAKALVDNLQMILDAARKHVEGTPLAAKHADALIDINELLAWGLNNREFQTEVLEQFSVKSNVWGNKLVKGMTGFIKSMVNFLFKGTSNGRKEIAESGLGTLIGVAGGLFVQASQNTSRYDSNQSMSNPVEDIVGLSTTDLYKALVSPNGETIDTEHNDHLLKLLNGIVQQIHGPAGTFKAELMASADLSGSEIFAEAMTSGQIPFGSEALNIGGMTEQEAYVLEQVEATVAAALEDGGAQTGIVHRELLTLYTEMRTKLKPQHFHVTNATDIEIQEANEIYNFLFKVEADGNGKSDYLARFAAIGLVHKEVRDAMKIATNVRSPIPADIDFLSRLMVWFEKALGLVSAKLTKTFPGMNADQKLGTLVQQLVDAEIKRKRIELIRAERVTPISDSMDKVSDIVRSKVVDFGQSKFFKQSNVFVKSIGEATSIIAGDRLAMFGKTLNDIRDAEFEGRQGFFAGVLRELTGTAKDAIVFDFLGRAAKRIEGTRKDIMTGTAKLVLESFANKGKDLEMSDRKAVSAGVLRVDMGILLTAGMSMSDINVLVQNEKALDREISLQESKLTSKYKHFHIMQSALLGYQLATGDARDVVFENAHNIAHMYETDYEGRLTEAETLEVEKVVDVLATLYGMKHTRTSHKMRLKKVFKAEMGRNDGGNGLELAMKMHQKLQQESKERLFGESPQLFMKGYTSEIYNPYKTVVAANDAEGKELELKGYKRGDPVVADTDDVNQEKTWLFTLHDGGNSRRVSGTVSTTGMKARGTGMHDGNIDTSSSIGKYNRKQMDKVSDAKRKALRLMFKANPNFDPASHNKGKQFMVPVFNDQGKIANWRYMMKQSTKDRVLDRDNRFDQILGTMAGSIYDKQITKTQNREVIKALKQQYDLEYGQKPRSYVTIGPMASDPEFREIYNLLPQDTKDAIREMFGKDEMKVRVDLLDLNFGYRKLSWADNYKKDRQVRDLVDQLMIIPMEYIFKGKAELRVRQGQLWWQTLVQMTKDNMVVKSFSTLAGNFKSNVTELLWFGVNPLDIIKHHRVAFRGALDYRRDTSELFDLEEKLKLDYMIDNRKEMEARVIILKDAVERNPIKGMIDAGLMPTIVEDIDMQEDIHSYKTRFVRATEKVTSKMNPQIVTAGKWVLMTQDTPLYKWMSHGTQLSDFVARYTLYQHLTTRKDERMEKDAAVQMVSEAFVNYDTPSHRRMQALNDDGFMWFTKYYLRIQRVILLLMRDNPGKTMGMVGLESFFATLPTLLDSAAASRLGNNPMSTGALKFFDTIDDTMVIKALMSPFKG